MRINAVLDSNMFSGTLVAEDITSSSLKMIALPGFLLNSKLNADIQYELVGSDLSLSGTGMISLNSVKSPFSVHSYTRNATGENVKLTLVTELSHADVTFTRDTENPNSGGYSLKVGFSGSGNIAHLAHIGGLFTGIIMMRTGWYKKRWLDFGDMKRNRDLSRQRRVKQRVDELLDKVSQKGIQSLTKQEREFLERVRRSN